MNVRFGEGIDLAGVVVWIDGQNLLSGVADWGSLGSVSEGLGSVVQCVGGGSVGGGSVVQGIGRSSQDVGWGGRDGQKARENCNLKNETKVS